MAIKIEKLNHIRWLLKSQVNKEHATLCRLLFCKNMLKKLTFKENEAIKRGIHWGFMFISLLVGLLCSFSLCTSSVAFGCFTLTAFDSKDIFASFSHSKNGKLCNAE